jgi:fibronectin type 3 domain-containing protein
MNGNYKLEVTWKEEFVVYLKYYHNIFRELLSKTKKTLYQDSRSHDGDSKSRHLEYKVSVILDSDVR